MNEEDAYDIMRD